MGEPAKPPAMASATMLASESSAGDYAHRPCPQLRLPNSPEKIDLQFQRCESLPFIECGSISDAHGCIGYATKNTAMTYTHWRAFASFRK
ncbi:MAG: hypothetical protein WBW81_03275 [Methylocella sp.]